jgi:serine/threonine-protein kinase
MTEPPCPYEEEELLPVTLGESLPAEIQAHLESCPVCRRRLDILQAEAVTLRRALRNPASATASRHSLAKTSSARPDGTIGKYFVVGTLAEGGGSSVYRALHPELNKEVAIKLAGAAVEGRAEQDALVSRGRHLAELKHPNLVEVYDLGFHHGRPYLVLEYVRGVGLEQYAAQDRPTPRAAAALAAGVARGLAAAHQQGVTHPHLQSNDILIDETGRARFVGFGVTPGGKDAGTSGQGGDVVALGCVLFFLLTGRPRPPTGAITKEAERVRRWQVDEAALQAAGVTPRLRRVCRKALAADPAGRYAGAAELANDLDRFLNSFGKLRGVLGWTAVLLLAAGGVGALYWVLSRLLF